jgi:5-methylcytosine-specific restriction protein A
MPTKGPRNPVWSRDELLLALNLYLQIGLPSNQEHPSVHQLSERLRQLTDLTAAPNQQVYRNVNGVYLKLANFRALDPASSRKVCRMVELGTR